MEENKIEKKIPIPPKYLAYYIFIYAVLLGLVIGFGASIFLLSIEDIIKPLPWTIIFLILVVIGYLAYRVLKEIKYIIGFPEPKKSRGIKFKNTYNVLTNFYKEHEYNIIEETEFKDKRGKNWDSFVSGIQFISMILLVFLAYGIYSLIRQGEWWWMVFSIILFFILLCFFYEIRKNLVTTKFYIASKYAATITFDLKWYSILPTPYIYSLAFDTEQNKFFFVRYHFAVDKKLQKEKIDEIRKFENIVYQKRILMISLINLIGDICTFFSMVQEKVKNKQKIAEKKNAP